jgi:Ni/Co efflux regulator RcnB
VRRRARPAAAVGMVAAWALACAPAAVRAADDAVDLSGRWQLNEDRSEDARKKMEDTRDADRRGKGGIGGLGPIGPGPRGGGPMGGGPMGGGPMGGRPTGGRPRHPDDGTRGRGPLAEVMDPPKTLTITEAGGELAFDRGGDDVLRLRPDGKKVKREGGAVELKARWKDGELVVEAEREDGRKTVTSYRVTSDRKELQVTTRAELPSGDELTLRRIYDPAPPD